MFGPVVRLLAIYLAVGLAVIAFIKRDTLMGLTGDTGAARPVAEAPEDAGVDAETRASVVEHTAPSAPAAPATPAPAQPAAQQTPAQQVPAQQAPAQTPAPAPATLQTPTAPGTPRAPQATPAPQAPAAAQPSDDFIAKRDDARRAAWAGETDRAIALYSELLGRSPGDMDLNGELGNVYYMDGRYGEAAKHYDAAGRAAVAAGNRPQAQMLASILRALDPAAADALDNSIRAMP